MRKPFMFVSKRKTNLHGFILVLILSCSNGFCTSDSIDFDESFKKVFRAGWTFFLKRDFYNLYKRVPLVTQFRAADLYEKRNDEGHVTVLLHPLNQLGSPYHCAFVTEMYSSFFGRLYLDARLVSLQTKPTGADDNSSFIPSSGNGHHHVYVRNHNDIVNQVIWHADPSPFVKNGKYCRELVAYYPYKTFKVEKNKMLKVMEEIDDDALKNSYPYNLGGWPNHNCCSYVQEKLLKMGIKLDTERLPGYRAEVLKKQCDKIPGSPIFQGNQAQSIKSDSVWYVHVNSRIVRRVVNYKNSYSGWFVRLYLNKESLEQLDQ